jgi:hypothetical protein
LRARRDADDRYTAAVQLKRSIACRDPARNAELLKYAGYGR